MPRKLYKKVDETDPEHRGDPGTGSGGHKSPSAVARIWHGQGVLDHGLAWSLAFGTAMLTACSVWYVYRVLISESPPPQLLVQSPGLTVRSVNVFAHVIVFLLSQLLCEAFEALRWSLASRDEGVSESTFLALGKAQPLFGVASLLVARGSHLWWCTNRYFAIGISAV